MYNSEASVHCLHGEGVQRSEVFGLVKPASDEALQPQMFQRDIIQDFSRSYRCNPLHLEMHDCSNYSDGKSAFSIYHISTDGG